MSLPLFQGTRGVCKIASTGLDMVNSSIAEERQHAPHRIGAFNSRPLPGAHLSYDGYRIGTARHAGDPNQPLGF